MRQAVPTIFGFLLIVTAALAPAQADPFRSGLSAYNHKSYATAARLFLALAERGHVRAQSYLAFMYSTGRGVPKNEIAAAWWAQQAAEQGEPSAQYLLGLMYDKGQGVRQDYVLAYMWLNLSSAHASPRGRKFSARMREALATKMTDEQLAEAQYRSLVWVPVRHRRR
jgi:uncharacterized protein